MTRKAAFILALGIALVTAVAIWMFLAAASVHPIEELDNVYYSIPSHWADFYDHAPEGTGWIHLPKGTNRVFFKSDSNPALKGFVRSQVCGECHPDKYQGLQGTAHFRTSSEASPQTVLGKFGKESGRLETRDPQLHFEMTSEDGSLFQRVIVRKNGKTYEHTERFDFAIGSGNHGQSYLYWHGDELYQLPISYFSEAGGWINSPGVYRDGTADFARGIGHRCLDCHATYFAAAPGEDVRYARENYLLGVTCVRCHGHGWAHVQYHRTHPNDKAPRYIVQPGDLPRNRANEVCAQCHSGVGDLLAPVFTYQPGEPLDEYCRLDAGSDDPKNDDPHAANQLARLMKSRCYQASDSLTCAQCHDPHRQERGNLKLFAERCAKCHASGDCKLTGKLGGQIKDHCVQCHMPSRRDMEGAMQTTEGNLLPLLRDHYIKVWPDVAQQVMKKLSAN
jgi:Cytochrome c554 and c-prime